MTEQESKTVSGKQAISYRNYRRARDRALVRLTHAYPDTYRQLLAEENAFDEVNGKKWVGISGSTNLVVGDHHIHEAWLHWRWVDTEGAADASDDAAALKDLLLAVEFGLPVDAQCATADRILVERTVFLVAVKDIVGRHTELPNRVADNLWEYFVGDNRTSGVLLAKIDVPHRSAVDHRGDVIIP